MKLSVILFGCLTAYCSYVAGGVNICTDESDFQRQRLYSPTPAQQQKEQQRFSVFIYDHFTDTEVQCFVENYPERIPHAMFVNTIVTDQDGNARQGIDGAVTEDDGCD